MKRIFYVFAGLMMVNNVIIAQDKGRILPSADVKQLDGSTFNTSKIQNDGKPIIISFWATWCKPCVQELPDFMDVNKMYQSNPNFKMILVSLDMASDVESAVRPFLKKNKMDVNVYLLDDNKHMNDWIPAVDKQWTGAIPATVLYRNGVKLAFRESKIGKIELVELIRNYL